MGSTTRRLERTTLTFGPGVESELVVGGSPATVGEELGEWVEGRTVCLVSAAEIRASLGSDPLTVLRERAAGWVEIEVPDGETAKGVDSLSAIWQRWKDQGVRRDARVVALGGGAICDLAGLAAATYMRGLELALVPTTLLAQVDAAVGGKTGINFEGAKNLIGAFHPASRVVSVTDLLRSLPRREVFSGLAEVVKVAWLLAPELLERLEQGEGPLDRVAGSDWVATVAAAQRAKVAVVERDPKERGERRVLNFGHTLGHALEAELRDLTHGEAVAWGMSFALELGRDFGLSEELAERGARLIRRLEPPALPTVDPDALMAHLGHDKKATREGVIWVVPTGFQQWRPIAVPSEQVRDRLETFVARTGRGC